MITKRQNWRKWRKRAIIFTILFVFAYLFALMTIRDKRTMLTAQGKDLIHEPNHPEGFRSDWWDIDRPPNMDLLDNIQQDFIITLWEHIVVTKKRSIENSKKIKDLIHEREVEVIDNEPLSLFSKEKPEPDPDIFLFVENNEEMLLQLDSIDEWPPLYIKVYDGDKELKYFAEPDD